MPTSTFQHAQKANQPEGSSTGRGRRKSKPTSKARARRQRTKDRYAHAREDAQLEGLIPTTPEEALTPERVPPSAQSEQPLPELIAQAIRKGWAVDEQMKPQLVQELIGIVMSCEEAKHKVTAFNALRMADQHQWERDNPETAGKAKGGNSISVTANVEAAILLREIIDHGDIGGAGAVPALDITGAPGTSGHAGEVQEPATPASHNGSAG